MGEEARCVPSAQRTLGDVTARPLALRVLETAVLPLDGLRRGLYRALGPLARLLLARRATRVTSIATLAMCTAFALTVLVPLWLLTLGPIVLGVPHLIADARYLVVRPGLHRRPALWVAGLATSALVGLTSLGVRAVFVGLALVVVLARGVAFSVRVGALTALVIAAVPTWIFPRESDLLFAHLHNFVAVALWLTLFHRRDGLAWRRTVVPLALFIGGYLSLVAGVWSPVVDALGGWAADATGTPLGTHLLALAPFATHLGFARGLLLAFAFAQSVHYSTWLRVIPDEARERDAPRSFRQSMRALARDFSAWGALACVALALALVLSVAPLGLAGARELYLRVALSHGHLELLVALLVVLEPDTRRRCLPAG